MDKNPNNGFAESVKKVLEDRFGSLMYGTFIISWCIWNWVALYATIFLDQDLIFQKFCQLKIEYLVDIYSKLDFFGLNIGGFWTKFLLLLLGPLVSSFFIVWILSLLDRVFLKKGYDNKFKSDQIETDYKIKCLTLKKREFKEETREVEQQIKKVNKEKILAKKMTDEDKWDLEYKQMKSGGNFGNTMKYFVQCLYEHDGWVEDGLFRKQSEFIVFFDVNGMSSFIKGARNRIEPTEKGKYILKLYTQEK